jgi:pyrimidine deaminase RibD-like protein
VPTHGAGREHAEVVAKDLVHAGATVDRIVTAGAAVPAERAHEVVTLEPVDQVVTARAHDDVGPCRFP